jgi:hypothetical protein
MALLHISMALNNLELRDEDVEHMNVPLILDSSSAIAIGNSFKDTKHTRHITRRFHFVRILIDKKFIILNWITTKRQLSDIGTKILGSETCQAMLPICMSQILAEESVQEE